MVFEFKRCKSKAYAFRSNPTLSATDCSTAVLIGPLMSTLFS